MFCQQMVTETDKRKAGELRAQHDAHSLVISQMERDSRAQLVKLVSLILIFYEKQTHITNYPDVPNDMTHKQ